jgi:SAM-dependent methyltransferase
MTSTADIAFDAAGQIYHGIFAKLKQLGIYDSAQPVDLYGHGLADFYNRFVGDYAADFPVFQKLLRSKDARVLDLACGSARVGIALAREGYTVDGVELSQDMLDLVDGNLAHEKPGVRERLTFVRGDMSAFEMPHQYDLILIGVTSISLLLTPEQRAGLFACVKRHLKPDGRFVFDVLDFEEGRWKQFDDYQDVWAREVDDGQDFAIIGQKFFPERGIFTFNVYREFITWSGETTRTIGASTKAFLLRDDLIPAMKAHGLAMEDEFLQGDLRYFVARHAEQ